MAKVYQSVAKASVSLPSFSASHLVSVPEMEATLESQRVPKAPVHLGTTLEVHGSNTAERPLNAMRSLPVNQRLRSEC